jgi:DNA invertase Pin-like site-specific DNA recombinase
MLEDGLAIAELVKREERNAKRRAKRGSAPKATADLLQIIKRLEEIGAGFRSLTEAIDTTTPVGRMLTQVLGSFAEFEREMIRERTKLGLARARLEGRVGGNRASLTPKQQAHALAMIDEGKSQSEVAEVFRVHRSTICRLVAERRVLERA